MGKNEQNETTQQRGAHRPIRSRAKVVDCMYMLYFRVSGGVIQPEQ